MIGAIVQARMGSTRLPGKTLRRVGDRPLLGHLTDRLRRSRRLRAIVIATTDAAADGPLLAFAEQEGLPVFAGSEDDVLDRYRGAAERYGIDPVVRVTADCPLMDPSVVDLVVDAFVEGHADYVSNAAPPPVTYPDGMDVEVFSRAALERTWREAVKPSDREHVTFYLWNRPDLFTVRRIEHDPDWSDYRLTVDYAEDLAVVEAVLARFSGQAVPPTLAEIVKYLDEHPAVKALNARAVRNAGWASAFAKDRAQGFWEANR